MKTIRVFPFALSKNYGYTAEQYRHIAAALFKYLTNETMMFEVDFRYMVSKEIALTLNRLKANSFLLQDAEDINVHHVKQLDNSSFAECLNEYSLSLYAEKPRAALISCNKDDKQLLLVSAPSKYNQHFFIDINKSKMYGTDNLLYGFKELLEKYYTADSPEVLQFYTIKKTSKNAKKKLKMK